MSLKRYLWLVVLLMLTNVTQASHAQDRYDPNSLEWSPDGNRLLIAYSSGQLDVLDATTLEIVFTYFDPDNWMGISDAQWSPDGTMIAVIGADYLHILNASNGAVLYSYTVGEFITSVDWHPTQAVIAYSVTYNLGGGERKTVEIWDLITQEHREVHQVNQGYEISDLAWSPDGTQLVVTNPDTETRIVDVQTGTALQMFGDISAVFVEWSTYNDVIATTSIGGSVHFRDATSGEFLGAYDDTQYPFVNDMAWQPNGDYFAVVSGRQTEVINIWDFTTQTTVAQLGDGDGATFAQVAWSPDGSKIAYADETGRIVITELDAIITQ